MNYHSMKHSYRSLPNFSKQKHINVDRENDLVKNIEIAKYGRNKNESFFDEKFLQDLVSKGNEATQGVKSRFGHPNMCASSLGTYIGRYKNFNIKGQKVYADLYLDPISKKTEVEGKGIKMYDYIMDMAESNSDMFGNSIVIMGDRNQEELENEEGEVTKEVVMTLQSFLASDLVDDPAATDALFSVENDFGVIMTEFLDQNPQLFDVANDKPEIFMDFLQRYEAYQKRKPKNANTTMNLFNKLKEQFGSKKEEDENFDVDLTLATGGIVTVVTENEEPQDGDAVQDEEGNAVADGEHLLADGRTIVTEGGNITEIREAEEEEEGVGQEEQNSVAALNTKMDEFTKNFANAINMISDQFAKQDKDIKNLQKTVTSKKFSAPKKTERKKIQEEGEDTFEAKIQAQREARKAKDE